MTTVAPIDWNPRTQREIDRIARERQMLAEAVVVHRAREERKRALLAKQADVKAELARLKYVHPGADTNARLVKGVASWKRSSIYAELVAALDALPKEPKHITAARRAALEEA